MRYLSAAFFKYKYLNLSCIVKLSMLIINVIQKVIMTSVFFPFLLVLSNRELQDDLTDEMVVLAWQLKERSVMMNQSIQNTEKVSGFLLAITFSHLQFCWWTWFFMYLLLVGLMLSRDIRSRALNAYSSLSIACISSPPSPNFLSISLLFFFSYIYIGSVFAWIWLRSVPVC